MTNQSDISVRPESHWKKCSELLESQFHQTEALNYGLVHASTRIHRIILLTTHFKCLNYLTANRPTATYLLMAHIRISMHT